MPQKTPISHLSRAERRALDAARVCHKCGAPACEKFRRLWWCHDCMIAEDSTGDPELQTRTQSSLAGAEQWRPF